MRPARFETFLSELFRQVPEQVTDVRTVREAGYERCPYGLVVTCATGARLLLQIVGTTAPGDKLSEPEQIVEGDTTPAEQPVPELVDGGRVRLDRVDRYLAALVANSGSREVADIEVFSQRAEPRAVRYGARFAFHSGAVTYVYVVHALPPGRHDWPAGREFDVPATV